MPTQSSKKSHKKFKNIPKKHTQKHVPQKSVKETVVFQQKQFPNIYRWITERFKKIHSKRGKQLVVLLLIFLLVLIIVSSANIFYLVSKEQYTESKSNELELRFQKWQTIAHIYPGYASAYVQLATISYDLGNKKAAKIYIEQALQYDPNNKDIQEVAEKIED